MTSLSSYSLWIILSHAYLNMTRYFHFNATTHYHYCILTSFVTHTYYCNNIQYMYSPSPPAPRKMPPTASASHSRDTPMIMQPATMLSRAEPTRRPWYSPTLTGFIQGAEHFRVTLLWIEISLATSNNIRRTAAVSFSVTLSDTEALSLAEPPLLFSPAQDPSCIFKWRYQLTISRVVV